MANERGVHTQPHREQTSCCSNYSTSTTSQQSGMMRCQRALMNAQECPLMHRCVNMLDAAATQIRAFVPPKDPARKETTCRNDTPSPAPHPTTRDMTVINSCDRTF